MILYTSDLHFGHSNVIRFDHRPFADRDEMDHVLIELWNGRVQPDDTVYIVGDLCHRSGHSADWYLRQLKGHKFLVLGNHDLPILDKAGVELVTNPAEYEYFHFFPNVYRSIEEDTPRIITVPVGEQYQLSDIQKSCGSGNMILKDPTG